MENMMIRNEAKKLKVRHWEIADYIGVSEQTFVRRLRKELPSDQQEHVLNAIHAIAEYKAERGV